MKLNDSERSSNKVMSQLAHDLQQPLRIITMMLDLLFKKNKINLSSEQQKYVQYIFDAADEACKIIRDFAQKNRQET